MPDKHCEYSPSASAYTLLCPGRLKLHKHHKPKHEAPNRPAEEGTLAHSMAEEILRARKTKAIEDLSTHRRDPLYNEDLERYARRFANIVWDQYKKLKGKKDLLIEKQVKLPTEQIEIFGTADAILMGTVNGDQEVWVYDLKTGHNPVSAYWDPLRESGINSQLGIYAAGAIRCGSKRYPDIKRAHLIIIQPSIYDGDSIVTIETEDLNDWIELTLKPNVKLAFSSNPPLKPGEKQCKYCNAANHGQCQACIEFFEPKRLDIDMLERPFYLNNMELSELINRWEPVVKLLDKAKEELTERVLSGQKIYGWETGTGNGSRKFKDISQAVELLKSSGVSYETLVGTLTVASAERMIKKSGGNPSDLEIIKTPGKTVVKRSNKIKIEDTLKIEED